MPVPRRFTPSISLLSAFEAVARLGSVTRAAQELDLTQGAVSRQVQKLEDLIGVELFRREGKRLELAPHGAAYADEVRQAINQIATATIALRANPGGGALNLGVLPAFGAHWLAPRLPDFLTRHPGITLNLTTRTEPFDFSASPLHAAIHFGQDDWPGTTAQKLWDEEMVAVASPDMVPQTAAASDISGLPRLQLVSRPKVWDLWCQANGTEPMGGAAMVLDQFATMVRAAQAGMGVALIPRYLVYNELSQGTLKEISGRMPFVAGSYFLVWPRSNQGYPALAALRDWLAEICN